MKFWVFVLASYFLILNVIPCIEQMGSCQGTTCCSTSGDDSADSKQHHDQSEEGCLACNPLGCDCCAAAFPTTTSFNFSTVSTHLVKQVNYSEFIPSYILFSIWQPPKTA